MSCSVAKVLLILLAILMLLDLFKVVAVLITPDSNNAADKYLGPNRRKGNNMRPSEFQPNLENPDNMTGCAFFPGAFIIGAQESGTTDLHSLFEACHVSCYKQKELHILDSAVLYNGIDQEELCTKYKELTKNEFKGKVVSSAVNTATTVQRLPTCVDNTPSYSIVPGAAKIIRASGKQTVIILKDPIDMLVSNVNAFLGRKSVKEDQEITLRQLNQSVANLLDASNQYAMQGLKKTNETLFNAWEFQILRSCYDRVFYLYQRVSLQVVFYEDLTSCSDYLFSEVLPELLGSKMQENVKCMQQECNRQQVVYDSKHIISRSDLPPAVVEYVRRRNTWYYSEKKKRRRRRI